MTTELQKEWVMSLGQFSGVGFLLSDGVELKFGQSGIAYARLPLSFTNRKRAEDGTWSSDKELKVEGTVFGPLAEFLNQEVQGRQEIAVSGELFQEEYTTKAGETKVAIRMNVNSAAPFGKARTKVTSGSRSASDVPF